LISTHILQEVKAVAGHVILINEGRIVFDGTPDEMAAGESLEDAFYRLTGGPAEAAETGTAPAAEAAQAPQPIEATEAEAAPEAPPPADRDSPSQSQETAGETPHE
jgi:ABC-type multidrug transport system ATPase subunit